jgi:hypothetical protein
MGVAVLVIVAVYVTVGVGVADFNGELSPSNQKITITAPAISNIAAPIITAIGVLFRICSRLRCASIIFWGESFSLICLSSQSTDTR